MDIIPHNDSDLPQSSHSTTGGSARVGQDVILVIDDDAEVLNSVRRVLRREGWVVLTISDPLGGLQVYEALWPAIHLVLLDYFMPNLRGDEVFERLHRINPLVRVLLTTSCDDYVSQKMLQGGLCGFIQKPISLRDLTRKIHHAMNHHDPPTLRAETAQINQDSICKIGFLP
ncbi:MAG: response regulator [Verrucomicrobiia bacterium]|jgi:CheY-like chemotaxis protein